MIDVALAHLTQRLNQWLRLRLGVQDDLAVAAPLQELDGSAVTEASNRVAVFLVNLERDTLAHRQTYATGRGSSRTVDSPEPVHLNLMVMFAASFTASNYREALKLISAVVSFFQGSPVFDRQNSPELDGGIERLSLEIESMDVSTLSNLWSILGSRYVPSVLYRVRMLAIESETVRAQPFRILTPSHTVVA